MPQKHLRCSFLKIQMEKSSLYTALGYTGLMKLVAERWPQHWAPEGSEGSGEAGRPFSGGQAGWAEAALFGPGRMTESTRR